MNLNTMSTTSHTVSTCGAGSDSYPRSNAVKDLIMHFKTQLNISYKSALAEGLLKLFDLGKEEDPDSTGISAGSLRSFFNFLQINPHFNRPDMALTPSNNVFISWRSEKSKVFSIEFESNDVVHFVVFAKHKLYPDMIRRASGTDLVSTIMKSVEAYDVSSWVHDAGYSAQIGCPAYLCGGK